MNRCKAVLFKLLFAARARLREGRDYAAEIWALAPIKARAFSLWIIALLLLGCGTSSDWSTSGPASWGAMAMNAAAGFLNQLAGVPLLPTSASAPGACPESDPTAGPQSEGYGSGACAPGEGDDPCVACAKARCCEASMMCFDEGSCVCNVACNTTGPAACPETERAGCGPEDEVYDTLVSCLVDHCEQECPNQ